MGYFRPESLPCDPDLIEARQDARLLLMVVHTRTAKGALPFELAGALARLAQDERQSARLRVRAAEALARLRLAGLHRGHPA